MRAKFSISFLIAFMAIRLPAQNSASHQITIRVIGSNSVSMESLPEQPVTLKQSGGLQPASSLLTWQTGGNPDKITLSKDESKAQSIETASPDLEGADGKPLSEADQNLTSIILRGNGRCLVKWPARRYDQDGNPVKVNLTVVEM
jgi:hypothetical protein